MSHRSSMKLSRMIDLGARRKLTDKVVTGGSTVEQDNDSKRQESTMRVKENTIEEKQESQKNMNDSALAEALADAIDNEVPNRSVDSLSEDNPFDYGPPKIQYNFRVIQKFRRKDVRKF